MALELRDVLTVGVPLLGVAAAWGDVRSKLSDLKQSVDELTPLIASVAVAETRIDHLADDVGELKHHRANGAHAGHD